MPLLKHKEKQSMLHFLCQDLPGDLPQVKFTDENNLVAMQWDPCCVNIRISTNLLNEIYITKYAF